MGVADDHILTGNAKDNFWGAFSSSFLSSSTRRGLGRSPNLTPLEPLFFLQRWELPDLVDPVRECRSHSSILICWKLT